VISRSAYLKLALEQMGKPYRWGAKGIDLFDCSGLVTSCLHRLGGPDWRLTHNTDRLLLELPETHSPLPGDLCLYGAKNDANHVMLWLGSCGLVFGASGGGRDTASLEIARKQNACVKVKSSHEYRPDFLGFRSLSQFLKE
jgi:murein DD-endopeptidase